MLFRRQQPPAPPVDIRLVVGLGNMGREYEGTRHNIGFEVVDELARQHQAQFRGGKFKGDETTIHLNGQRVLLLKPRTFMNLSGESVAAAARFYKLDPTKILIVCDDVYLPVGKLRLRARGSAGGHNGLTNIIQRLGSQEFARLRIGVGEAPSGWDMRDYVLSRFTAGERTIVREAADRAAQAAETWVLQGIDAAMNRWNATA